MRRGLLEEGVSVSGNWIHFAATPMFSNWRWSFRDEAGKVYLSVLRRWDVNNPPGQDFWGSKLVGVPAGPRAWTASGGSVGSPSRQSNDSPWYAQERIMSQLRHTTAWECFPVKISLSRFNRTLGFEKSVSSKSVFHKCSFYKMHSIWRGKPIITMFEDSI